VARIGTWLGAGFCFVMLFALAARAQAQGDPYVNFETIPTRALAMSPDGARLFVANTPDGRLEIFDISESGSLTAAGSVAVGLDPVAVAARTDTEVWVVNLLSDSVSIVDVSGTPRVVRTLFVGDEPRDIVFAGPNGKRAFITAARRGQNHPDDTVDETQRPGVGRADVWVFDVEELGASAGGDPLTIITLFSDKPGALSASADGSDVFVSVFTSGNSTATISDQAVCGTGDENTPMGVRGPSGVSDQADGPCALLNGGTAPGGNVGPNRSQVGNVRNPRTGLIVQFDGASGSWLDAAGRDWRDAVPFSLPDNDVFVIDATATPPRESGAFQGVGTLNKSLAVNPVSGKLVVATIEAINTNRFISVPRLGLFPNPDAKGGTARTADPVTGKTLNGHLYESRIAILEPGQPVISRHLNKHIDYEVVPSPPGVKERSVADPQGLAFSADGSTLFVAALGSNKIVPFDTQALEDDSFVPDAATHILLSGDGGPTDMIIRGNRMFVYKRFDNSVATVDLDLREELAVTPLFSPEPPTVTRGRKFFYDALLTSSNGEANCNVCHPAGDKDDLAWNLGTPFAGNSPNPNPFIANIAAGSEFNPLKGPMTVLTLRGIKDSGPMFWRGEATNAQDPLDERLNFQNFNGVFESLLGRESPLADEDFQAFTDWVLTLVPPPNPHRPLDGRLTPNQASGQNIFLGGEGPTDGPFSCSTCHAIDAAQGFFGTRGAQSVEGETQEFKVTQLRTTYDKVGMFGQTDGADGDPRTLGGPRGRGIGPQIRGTGNLHDGSAAGPEDFLTAVVFRLDARQLREVVDFVYAFPSNLAPVVGQQISLTPTSGPDAMERLNLLMDRARAPFMLPGGRMATECDLVAKGVIDGVARGFLFDPEGEGFSDDAGDHVSTDALLAIANIAGQELTFTCIYPGGGQRFGIDRDLDGQLDNLETPLPPSMQPPVQDAGEVDAPAPRRSILRSLLQRLLRRLSARLEFLRFLLSSLLGG